MYFPATPEEIGRYAEGSCKHVSVQPFRTKVIDQTRHIGLSSTLRPSKYEFWEQKMSTIKFAKNYHF